MAEKKNNYKPSQQRIDERNKAALAGLVEMYGRLPKDNSPKKGQPKKPTKK